MRINEPVTDREILLKDGEPLVSKTDAGGRILFVNRSFIDISGFTEAELIGQPHNIVRHPDMPKEAFADLWKTIKAGRAWEGLVKNRTKQGDYYWVRANVTPVMEDGQITGFLSVRSKPSRDEVAAATGLYRMFRAGTQGRRIVSEGKVVSTGLGAKLGRLRESIVARVVATLVILTLSNIAIGGIGLIGMSDTNEAANSMFVDRIKPLKDLKVVADMYAVNIVDTTHKVHNSSGVDWDQGLASIDAARKTIDEHWKAYTATYLTPEEAGLKDEAQPLMADADKSVEKLEGILKAQDMAALDSFVKTELYQKIDPISAKISQLVELQPRVAEEILNDINSDFTLHGTGASVVSVISIILALVMSVVVFKSLRGPIRRIESQLSAIARADYASPVLDDPLIEYRPINANIRTMRAQLGYAVLEKKEIDEQAAIKRREALRAMANAVESESNEAVNSVAEYTSEMAVSAKDMYEAASIASSNSQAVAAAATQMLSSSQTVATATEELTASIKEISQQIGSTATISQETMAASESTMGDIRKLSTVVDKISTITGVIREVAAQTNLLALNATIEAARAGDAGKGFAVVAGEVKNLAAQTANSTAEIEKTVEEIKTATQASVQSVSGIVMKIQEVNSYTTSIASAVEEQAAATGEIARSVSQASEAAQEVASRINSVGEQISLTEQRATGLTTLSDKVDLSVKELKAAIVRAVRHVDGDVDRREHKRLNPTLPMVCHVAIGGKRYSVRLVDISLGGARVEMDSELPKSAFVEIDIGSGVPPMRIEVKEHTPDMLRGNFDIPPQARTLLEKFVGSLTKTTAKAAQ
jgi:methyl-accepting chemotaxis protein/aerotaxis receptor